MFANKSILFLAPHTDDVELGCGGTLVRALEEGARVFVAAFSTAQEALPEGVEADSLKNEFYRALHDVLGLPNENLFTFNYPVRRLSYHRQDVLEDLLSLKREICPSVVFIPSGNDLHQDHQVLHNEALRAYKELTIFGYELPWNHIEFSAQAFIILKEKHIQMKWKALEQYKTQIDLKRPYFSYQFIESLARIRGVQIKEEYAEAFELIRAKI